MARYPRNGGRPDGHGLRCRAFGDVVLLEARLMLLMREPSFSRRWPGSAAGSLQSGSGAGGWLAGGARFGSYPSH